MMRFQRGGISVKGGFSARGTLPGLIREKEPSGWGAGFSGTFLNYSNCTNPVPRALKSLHNFEYVALPLWALLLLR